MTEIITPTTSQGNGEHGHRAHAPVAPVPRWITATYLCSVVLAVGLAFGGMLWVCYLIVVWHGF